MEPLAYCVFLFGPGARTLREVVTDSGPELDASSGHLLHWVPIGDPRGSQPNFRQSLRANGPTLEELEAQWAEKVRRWGPEMAVTSEESAVVRKYSVSEDEMPVLLVFLLRISSRPMHLRLPRRARADAVVARQALVVLCAELNVKRVEATRPKSAEFGGDQHLQAFAVNVARVQETLDRIDGGPPTDAGDWVERALMMLRDGKSVTQAAKFAGVHRSTLYDNSRTKEIIDARRSMREGRKNSRRRGVKRHGVAGSSEAEE